MIDMKTARAEARARDLPLVTFKCDERTMTTEPQGGRAVTEFAGPVDYGRALAAYKVLIGSPLDEDDLAYLPKRFVAKDGQIAFSLPPRTKKPGRRPDL